SVTVLTNPQSPNQTCTVSNGSGVNISANVTNIAVSCVKNYSIGGTVSGLAIGNTVLLQNNSGNDLMVNSDGVFIFNADQVDGSNYAVSVLTQPSNPNQTCTVIN